jgi:hypothetical protein
MTDVTPKRVLVYKRTHEGDPDPQAGVFGNNGCMKSVRGWDYDAVIGVGGIGHRVESRIKGKLTWIGIGPHKDKMDKDDHPLVTFDHFLYFDVNEGPQEHLQLRKKAPALARRMYDRKARWFIVKPSDPAEWKEVEHILHLAKNAPPSADLSGPPTSAGRCKRSSH